MTTQPTPAPPSAKATHDALIDAASRFVRVFDDPHPGLASWNIAAEQCYQCLREEVNREETWRAHQLNNATDALLDRMESK